MPRYDYQCTSCGHEFELRQSFKEAGTGICPSCAGEGRRVFHAVPVIYKGSGFYTTDYGRPKTRVDNEKEKQEKEPSESKSTKKSETKGDAPASTASEAKT